MTRHQGDDLTEILIYCDDHTILANVTVRSIKGGESWMINLQRKTKFLQLFVLRNTETMKIFEVLVFVPPRSQGSSHLCSLRQRLWDSVLALNGSADGGPFRGCIAGAICGQATVFTSAPPVSQAAGALLSSL